MLIQDALLDCERNAKLQLFVPQRRGLSRVREVYISESVGKFLDGATDQKFLAAGAVAIAVLESFSSGRAVSFALNPHNKNPSALVARNAPESHGVVALRIKHKKVQARIFGAFACKDLLVLLRWKDRDLISDFNKEVNETNSIWRSILPNHRPLFGSSHDDYISKPYSIG